MGIEISQLPLPQVSPSGVQLLDILSTQDPDFKKLEAIINKDPTLASSIIKYANSPLYHRHSKISNLRAALNLLGLKNIRSAVVMAIMRSQTKNQNKIDELIWEHSQVISTLCQLTAKVCAPKLADDMQLIGLIHDIGMLVLNQYDGKKYQKLVYAAQQSDRQAQISEKADVGEKANISEKANTNEKTLSSQNLDSLEAQAFGFSHDAVTIRICEHFRFAEHIGLVINGYHGLSDSTSAPFASSDKLNSDVEKMRCILSLAHHFESQIEGPAHCFPSTNPIEFDNAIALLHIDEALVSKIIKSYPEQP